MSTTQNHPLKPGQVTAPDHANEHPALVKARTLAGLLDCSPRQITYMAERGQILPIRLGPRCVRFDVADTLARLKGGLK